MKPTFNNRNAGLSAQDPRYDVGYDEEEAYDRYEEALLDRAEDMRNER